MRHRKWKHLRQRPMMALRASPKAAAKTPLRKIARKAGAIVDHARSVGLVIRIKGTRSSKCSKARSPTTATKTTKTAADHKAA
jgi:hypothetical protein